jgi:hypothetical protein
MCLLFIIFHVVAPITTKSGMVVEGVPVEVLGTCNRAWNPVQANLFPHYFLRNEVVGPRLQCGHDNNDIVSEICSW